MWGHLIAAGATLGAGLLGSRSLSNQRAANEQLQREFANNAISWRVADAKRAGIHPLYALGAPTMSPAVSLGNDPMAAAVGSMGQDIGRAVDAGLTGDQKALGKVGTALSLENMQLQNDLLRSRIAMMNTSRNPSLPVGLGPDPNIIEGQGDAGIKVKPGETEVVAGDNASQAAVVVPDVAFSETKTGLAPIPSKSVKEQIEDIWIPQLLWGLRNNLLPIAGINQNPPSRSAGEGKVWVFHPGLGEYQAVDRNSMWAKMFGRKSEVWR